MGDDWGAANAYKCCEAEISSRVDSSGGGGTSG